LKLQIAQLEATLKADVGEKGGILDKLCDERGLCPFLYHCVSIVNLSDYACKNFFYEISYNS